MPRPAQVTSEHASPGQGNPKLDSTHDTDSSDTASLDSIQHDAFVTSNDGITDSDDSFDENLVPEENIPIENHPVSDSKAEAVKPWWGGGAPGGGGRWWPGGGHQSGCCQF